MPLCAHLLCTLLVLTHQDAPADPLPEIVPDVTARELEAHVRFLASDELLGRATGTPECVRAARYLGRALAAAGVEPAGDDGGFLQEVALVRETIDQPPVLIATTKAGERIAGRYGVDFTLSSRGAPRATGELAVLVARALSDLPEGGDPAAAAFLDLSGDDRRAFMRQSRDGELGSFGLVVRAGPEEPGEPRTVRSFGLRRADQESAATTWVTLRGPLRGRLVAGELATLRLEVASERERVADYNVVGRVRGRGTTEHPELADEVIVLSAHFDHIGVASDAEPGADAIYNGADDDASGTAAVLEIAAALAAGEPPARTVVFLLATGEEVGLLGTEAYLDAPAEPLERTVLNLNFEMIGRPDALVGGSGRLWLTGYELSNLGPALAEAGLAVVPDGRPEQNFFRRSDNYAFVRRGVVGQTLSTYDLHEDYHHPSDEANTLDYQHMEQCVRSAFQAVRLVASGALTPAWVEGADPASR